MLDVLDRASGSAFKAAVYLLRREANLSLKEVAVLAGVSCPRISQIQRELDLAPDDKRLRRIRRAIK
jgi:transcriptional regulator with XRE-family HTH domain